jgi:hypothetical protein
LLQLKHSIQAVFDTDFQAVFSISRDSQLKEKDVPTSVKGATSKAQQNFHPSDKSCGCVSADKAGNRRQWEPDADDFEIAVHQETKFVDKDGNLEEPTSKKSRKSEL